MKAGRKERNALRLRNKLSGRIRVKGHVFAENHRIVSASLSIC